MASIIRTKRSILTLILLITLLPSITQMAFATTLTLMVDKTSYVAGDNLTVSGTVSPVTAGADVSIQVLNPPGGVWALAQAKPTSTGTFNINVNIFQATDTKGTYVVKAAYMDIAQQTTATFVPTQPVATTTVTSPPITTTTTQTSTTTKTITQTILSTTTSEILLTTTTTAIVSQQPSETLLTTIQISTTAVLIVVIAILAILLVRRRS